MSDTPVPPRRSSIISDNNSPVSSGAEKLHSSERAPGEGARGASAPPPRRKSQVSVKKAR